MIRSSPPPPMTGVPAPARSPGNAMRIKVGVVHSPSDSRGVRQDGSLLSRLVAPPPQSLPEAGGGCPGVK